MLSGLKALFTSGIIFRPMVMLGIISGFLMSSFLDWEEFFPLFSSLNLYLMMATLAGLYTLFFNQVYKGHGKELDYKAMGGKFVGNLFDLAVAGICSFLFFETLIF